MFEQIIRPFQSNPVLTTTRIVKSVAVATGQPAVLTWGAAGTVPAGVKQVAQTPAINLFGPVNIKIKKNDEWTQWGAPVTERVTVDGNLPVDRVRHIGFKKPDSGNIAPKMVFSTGSTSDIVPGQQTEIASSNANETSFDTIWN